MLDLRVELSGVDALLGVLHRGHGARGGLGGDDEALRDIADGVEVAHPHGLLHGRVVEQGALGHALELGRAILAHLRVEDPAAQGHGRDLVAVAEAKHGDAHLVDGRVDARGVLGVHARGTAGEDDGAGVLRSDLGCRGVARHDLRVDVQVADAARDELAVLGAEVEDDDLLLAVLHGLLRGTRVARVTSAWARDLRESRDLGAGATPNR